MTRYVQDLMGSPLACDHDLIHFSDSVPTRWRPKGPTAAFTWNIVGRDGALATVKVFLFSLLCAVRLWREVVFKRIEIVHLLSTGGYGFFRNGLHTVIVRLAGAKVIFHLLGQIDDLYRNSPRALRPLVRWCLDRANVNIVQSPGLAAFVQPLTKRPVVSIENGVNLRTFNARIAKTDERQPCRVLSVGTLGHKKGTFDLIEVAAQLKAAGTPVRLEIIGGGQVDHFRSLAAARGVDDVLHIVGPQPEQSKIMALLAADVFVLPSHAEGQPIAILEAMAASLPVVSTAVGSIPEVVLREGGYVVTPGDIGAIVGAIQELAASPTRRRTMGAHNRAAAEARFDMRRLISDLDQQYRTL